MGLLVVVVIVFFWGGFELSLSLGSIEMKVAELYGWF